MKINKEDLKILWYEDENGKVIPNPDEMVTPPGARYQVSRFPQSLTTTHLRLVDQEEVDKCRHPKRYVHPTYGWIDGIVGRECSLCRGTQTKKKWHFWPKKWGGHGSRLAFSFNSTWNDDKTVLAMVSSGDFTLSEAIIAYATACERCMNALAYKYSNGEEGYAEHSPGWEKCRTSCKFCVPVTGGNA
jgi:hypothetical protein